MGNKKFDAGFVSNSFKETVRLVKDAKDQPLVIFPENPGVCHALRSERVTRALRSHTKTLDMSLNSNRLEELIDELDAIAYEEGETIVAHYRVAPTPDGYTYHLGGSRYLWVTQGNPRLGNKPPQETYFIQSSSMLSVPDPTSQGNIQALLGLFNCTNTQKLLLLAWLTYVVSTPKAAQLPYPILVVRAPAGSGKSFMCNKLIRQLIDPSMVPSQPMPKNIKDIAISAQNTHVLILDNLRTIRTEMSDGLCMVATGGSIAGRKLYTDGEEFSMDLRCALVLNGIHTFVSESDLVSRCVNITLKPIPDEERCSEAELTARFEESLPSFIYTLHTLAAKVLELKDSAVVSYRNRMADFSCWVAALEAVLGQQAGVLQEAYKQNVEQAKVAGVVDDSLFVALTEFAKGHTKSSPWHGSPHELLSALEAKTVVRLGSDFPKNAAAMSRRIPVLLDALTSNGVNVVRGRATDRYYDVWFEPKTSQSRDECVEAADLPVAPSSSSPQVDATHVSDADNAEELLG